MVDKEAAGETTPLLKSGFGSNSGGIANNSSTDSSAERRAVDDSDERGGLNNSNSIYRNEDLQSTPTQLPTNDIRAPVAAECSSTPSTKHIDAEGSAPADFTKDDNTQQKKPPRRQGLYKRNEQTIYCPQSSSTALDDAPQLNTSSSSSSCCPISPTDFYYNIPSNPTVQRYY